MPSSVRRLTMLDHERLGRLVRRACTCGPGQRRWRDELAALLRAHRIAERDDVLGALLDHPGLAAAVRAQGEADVALDHLAAEAAELPLDGADQSRLDDWCEAASAAITAHTSTWAENLMGPLEELAPRAELRRLGGAYERARDRELATSGAVVEPPRRLDLSRAELYELARKAGIEGRSSMTRGQLISELQRLSSS